jgi:hypothetical protein
MSGLKLLALPVALSLLVLSFALPAASAAATCVGSTPSVCVLTGPCYGVSLRTGATDFYPGAAACKVAPVNGAALCERVYAGVGTLGGFYGPNVLACVGGSDVVLVCAGALGNQMDPVCL